MNLCPGCKNDRADEAGSPYACMDCGRRLGSRPSKPKRPPARQLSINALADGKRFRGRTPLPYLVFPLVSILMLGGLAAFSTSHRFPPVVVALFLVLVALAVLWSVLTLVHYSEVDVTPSGLEIRSFPIGGRSSGTYPRERVAAFGWIQKRGHKGSVSYDAYLALIDDRTVRVPIATESEAQCVYLASKLRAAFDETA